MNAPFIENKKKVFLMLLGLLLLAGWFYWSQYRPSKIRTYCHNRAIENNKSVTSKYYESRYDSCLHEKGLK